MFKNLLQGSSSKTVLQPLHPVLVHLPVGLWIASLVFDVLFFSTGATNFASASYYCIAAGLVAAILAAPTGIAEYATIPLNTRPKRIARRHLVLNIGVMILFGVNLMWRHMSGNVAKSGAPPVVLMGEFALSIIAIISLGASGYLGGLLVYDYGIGYQPGRPESGGNTRGSDSRYEGPPPALPDTRSKNQPPRRAA